MSNDLLKDRAELTLDEVCTACGIQTETVVTYVQEGLIDLAGDDVSQWRFSETQLVHLQKAHRLERDLRLNPAGSVLVLELRARIEQLETRLRRYEQVELDDDEL